MQPADSEHRFGHGKMESIAGLGQAAFIIGSGIFLFVEAIGRILNPVDIKMGSLGIGVMVFSMILTAGLVIFQRNVSQKTGSLAIKADSLHYTSDFLVNVAIEEPNPGIKKSPFSLITSFKLTVVKGSSISTSENV